MMDELNNVPKFKRAVKLYETLASGYYNVGNAIDIGDLYSTIGFNDVEGFRVRVGARTFFRQMICGGLHFIPPTDLKTADKIRFRGQKNVQPR